MYGTKGGSAILCRNTPTSTAALTASIKRQGFSQTRRFIDRPLSSSRASEARLGPHNHRRQFLEGMSARVLAAAGCGGHGPRPSPGRRWLYRLQNKPAQIGVLGEVAD